MDPLEKILATAIYKHLQKELYTPDELFTYLYNKGFFQTKQATNAFVNMLLGYSFVQTRADAQKFVTTHILEKIAKDHQKFPDVQTVFAYVDKIGLFFDDTDGRTKFMQLAEQMTSEAAHRVR